MDTQLIRNAYMGRPVEDIDMPFGKFACLYLNVDDAILHNLYQVNPACNYIIAMGYNQTAERLTWPAISSELPATTNVAD